MNPRTETLLPIQSAMVSNSASDTPGVRTKCLAEYRISMRIPDRSTRSATGTPLGNGCVLFEFAWNFGYQAFSSAPTTFGCGHLDYDAPGRRIQAGAFWDGGSGSWRAEKQGRGIGGCTRKCMRYWIAIVAVFDVAPPTLRTIVIAFPLVALVGIWKFTWYRPTKPGARPEKETGTELPPKVSVGVATVVAGGLLGDTSPAAGWFVTAPSPVQ